MLALVRRTGVLRGRVLAILPGSEGARLPCRPFAGRGRMCRIQRRPVGVSSIRAPHMTARNSAPDQIEALHDKWMAADFLATLDPTATRFTFQLFSDRGEHAAEI